MSKQLIAANVILCLLLAACSNPVDEQPPAKTNEPTELPTAQELPNSEDANSDSTAEEMIAPPQFYLIDAAGDRSPGFQGSYCWFGEPDDSGESKGICIDTFPPNIIRPVVPIQAGEPIRIGYDNPAPTTLYTSLIKASAFSEQNLGADAIIRMNTPTQGEAIEWFPDVPPGEYVLVLSGMWETGGDASYLFTIDWPGADPDAS